jgi:hypothetical protein
MGVMISTTEEFMKWVCKECDTCVEDVCMLHKKNMSDLTAVEIQECADDFTATYRYCERCSQFEDDTVCYNCGEPLTKLKIEISEVV